MTFSTAYKNRIKFFTKSKLLEIRIPTKKNTTALIAMVFATMLWVFTLLVLVRVTLSLHYFWYKAGLVLSIMGWFALGMAGASSFIWLFFGREWILLNKEFFHTKNIFTQNI